ncbi:MAG: RluA family pseudouridine synthase, partial [Planctomycetales bacterium]|nr:RluA family pseudouridine synthase [Planctomycetales bacterium]
GGPTRPGIVHRLDRDTSGVIVVAKTDEAHNHLARQFEQRQVEKEYAALVLHVPDLDRDLIRHPIADHPTYREKKAIIANHPSSRPAETIYEVRERFVGFAHVAAFPKTGRTHQIRIHLTSIGCPVLCDKLYGGRSEITRGEIRGDPSDAELLLSRQALHARRLRITHPASNESMEFVAPLPRDFQTTLDALREFRKP